MQNEKRIKWASRVSVTNADQIKNIEKGQERETQAIYTGSPFLKGYVQSSLPH